jgi:hypothetical protein
MLRHKRQAECLHWQSQLNVIGEEWLECPLHARISSRDEQLIQRWLGYIVSECSDIVFNIINFIHTV